MAVAYCYRSGEIGFGDQTPEGCLAIAQGDERRLRTVVETRARLARDNTTWLVPGVPEADSDSEAVDALQTFCRQVNRQLRRRG